jgi:hypothetical protein
MAKPANSSVEIVVEAPISAAPAVVEQPKRRAIGRPFPKGVSGNPAGRVRGSRNRLSDSFVSDLHACWEKHGIAALERVACQQPDVLVKVIASILPKDISLTVGVDAEQFVRNFRQARALLGNDDPPRLINGR